ncbi:MAG: glycosyltransferase family 2 protein, partial [Candidatus Edwardsbacteria bacterium]|nr:glycosyltransferase family 2 protein [Candidatus Edwardsbacteria bacterium]
AWNNGEGEIDRKQYEKSKNIAFASGCALWISKKVIEDIGLFDESYFCYYEDVDFSMRARRNGFSISYIPEAVVYHKSGVSSGGNKKAMYRSALADLLTLRNRIIFTNKYVRNRIIVTYSSLFVSFLLRILRKKTKRARLILKFMWFGLKGNGKLIREYPITSIMTYKD